MHIAEFIYVISGLVLLVVGFMYFVKRGVKSNKLWQQAYELRTKQLQAELPASDIFPALLMNIDYPGSGVAQGTAGVRTIAYVRQQRLVFEGVTYSKTPDQLQIHVALDLPCNQLVLQRPARDAFDKILYGDAVELVGGIYETPEGKKRKAGPYLIRENIVLSEDFRKQGYALNDKVKPDRIRQQRFIDELVKHGVVLKTI